MEVRELPLPAPVPPLGGEDDEVERVRGLHLQPAGAAPARLVRRIERLHHHALVAACERLVEKRLRDDRIVGLYPRNDQLLRETRRERDEPLAGRSVDEVGAVDVEAVEEEGAERSLVGRRRLRAEAAHRDLERLGTTVRTKRDRLAVEDDRIHVELSNGGCDLGYAIGDVREVACEEAHLAPRPVRLDAGAVELPLDAGAAEAGPARS